MVFAVEREIYTDGSHGKAEDTPRAAKLAHSRLDGATLPMMIRAVMSWYYSKNGTQLGPVAEDELAAKVKSGEVAATDLVWKEGMSDWKPSAQVPELLPSRTHIPEPAHLSLRKSDSVGGLPAVTQSAATGLGHIPIQQPVPYRGAPPRYIPNYLWQSIVATVLCCMPFGIPAIIYAARVDVLLANGDYVGAEAASNSAKTWATVAAACWLVAVIGYVAFVAIAVATSR